jgi:hypothetical protein
VLGRRPLRRRREPRWWLWTLVFVMPVAVVVAAWGFVQPSLRQQPVSPWVPLLAGAAALATVLLLPWLKETRTQRRELVNLVSDHVRGWHKAAPLRVRQADPVSLGVHRGGGTASHADTSDTSNVRKRRAGLWWGRRQRGEASLGSYVPRDVDAELDRALARGSGFVLLEGGPASGKSRTAYEGLRRAKRLRNRALLVPVNAKSLPALLAEHRLRHTVIWLDNLQRFLGPEGLTTGLLENKLLGPEAKAVTLLATIRTDAYDVHELDQSDAINRAHRVSMRTPLSEHEWEAAQQVKDEQLQKALKGVEQHGRNEHGPWEYLVLALPKKSDRPLVREVQLPLVGVHPAVAPTPGLRYRLVGQGPTVAGMEWRAPTYVPRKHDAVLREYLRSAAAQGYGLVLLTGRSFSGKTRSAWEAVHAEFPDWVFADCSQLPTILEDLAHRQPPTADTIIWLDDIQNAKICQHLAGNLRILFSSSRRSHRVVAVATSWPLRDWKTSDCDLRQVTDLAQQPFVYVKEEWDTDELKQAGAIANDDPYLEMALGYEDFGPTQVLAGAPRLFQLWEQSDKAETEAILTAAIDLTRLGLSALSRSLVRHCMPFYLERPSLFGESGFADAWTEVTTPVWKAVIALRPVSDAESGTESEYRLSDLLQDYGQQKRHWEPIPQGTWRTLTHAPLSRQLLTSLANQARNRMLYLLAEDFEAAALQAPMEPSPEPQRPSSRPSSSAVAAHEPRESVAPNSITSAGEPIHVDLTSSHREVADQLRREADRLRRKPDLDGLWTLAMSSQDKYVRRRLALLLVDIGDEESEKRLFDLAVYSRAARRELVEMLGRHGRIEDLLRQVVCGNGFATRALRSGWAITNLTDSERATILRDGLNPDGTVAAPHN